MFRVALRRNVRAAFVALSLSGIAACGSTVPAARVAQGAGTDFGTLGSSSTSSGGSLGATAPPSSLGVANESATGGSGPGASAPEAGSPRNESNTPTAASVVSKSGPIQIGIAYLDPGASNALVGSIGSGLALNDPKVLYSAYIADANKRGGILGRQIQPVFLKLDPSSSYPELGQEICTYFTEDHKVSFVLSPDIVNLVYPCLNSHGVATLTGSPMETSSAVLAGTRLALEPGTVAEDRLFGDVLVPRLDEMGYLSNKTTDKLGILYYDNQAPLSAFNAFKHSLAARGYAVGAAVSFHQPEGASDLASTEAAVKSAELRFKAEGVTHVMCIETDANLCGFFGIYAGQQGYYPRYAFHSLEPLTNITANLGPGVLKNSVFVGWNPAEDVQEETQMPANLRKCVAFFRQAGEPVNTGNRYEQAAEVCEEIQFLRAALTKAPSISATGLLQGAAALGDSFAPVSGYAVSVSQHRDGVAAVRQGSYVTGCSCFRYSSAPTRI